LLILLEAALADDSPCVDVPLFQVFHELTEGLDYQNPGRVPSRLRCDDSRLTNLPPSTAVVPQEIPKGTVSLCFFARSGRLYRAILSLFGNFLTWARPRARGPPTSLPPRDTAVRDSPCPTRHYWAAAPP